MCFTSVKKGTGNDKIIGLGQVIYLYCDLGSDTVYVCVWLPTV
jgi:hypothetical protein